MQVDTVDAKFDLLNAILVDADEEDFSVLEHLRIQSQGHVIGHSDPKKYRLHCEKDSWVQDVCGLGVWSVVALRVQLPYANHEKNDISNRRYKHVSFVGHKLLQVSLFLSDQLF